METDSGKQVWAQSFDREVTDLFTVQDEIVHRILIALQAEMTEGEQALISMEVRRPDLRAWVLAAQALRHLRLLTRGEVLRARELYERAIAIDPDYRGAWEGLAWTFWVDTRFAWGPRAKHPCSRPNQFRRRVFPSHPNAASTSRCNPCWL